MDGTVGESICRRDSNLSSPPRCVSTNAPDDLWAVRRFSNDWRSNSAVSYTRKLPAESVRGRRNKYGVPRYQIYHRYTRFCHSFAAIKDRSESRFIGVKNLKSTHRIEILRCAQNDTELFDRA